MPAWIRAILAVILCAFLIIIPLTLPQKLNGDEITDELLSRREAYYYGVLEVWQIDCFGGGCGSRRGFLLSKASAFERKHRGVYVHVEALSADKATLLLSGGIKKPDIISYGCGVEGLPAFSELPESVGDLLRQDLLPALQTNAVPWCMGAYCLLTQQGKAQSDAAVCRQEGYSIYRAASEGEKLPEGNWQEGTPQGMFLSFAGGRSNTLFGTQRELYRLKSAQERGKAGSAEASLLSEYTDLFQYFSVVSCEDEKKTDMAYELLNYYLSAPVQSALGEIGMFPVGKDATPTYDCAYASAVWQELSRRKINAVCTLGEECRKQNEKYREEILKTKSNS